MRIIKNIIKFFYPRDFKNDPYGWLTNQLGHIAGSAWITYAVFLPLKHYSTLSEGLSKWIALGLIGGLWIIWEIRHLIISGNWKDFLEDLSFEITGVFVVYNFILFGIIVSPVLVISLLFLKYSEVIKDPPEELGLN